MNKECYIKKTDNGTQIKKTHFSRSMVDSLVNSLLTV